MKSKGPWHTKCYVVDNRKYQSAVGRYFTFASGLRESFILPYYGGLSIFHSLIFSFPSSRGFLQKHQSTLRCSLGVLHQQNLPHHQRPGQQVRRPSHTAQAGQGWGALCSPSNNSFIPCLPRVYSWIDDHGRKVKCSAPLYTDYALSYIQELLTDEAVFPSRAGWATSSDVFQVYFTNIFISISA